MDYHQLMLENHTLFTKHVFHRLAPYALSSGQPRVLEYLARHDGAVQKDIAHACMIEPPSVTSVPVSYTHLRWGATLPKPLVRPAQPNTRFASVRLHGA